MQQKGSVLAGIDDKNRAVSLLLLHNVISFEFVFHCVCYLGKWLWQVDYVMRQTSIFLSFYHHISIADLKPDRGLIKSDHGNVLSDPLLCCT